MERLATRFIHLYGYSGAKFFRWDFVAGVKMDLSRLTFMYDYFIYLFIFKKLSQCLYTKKKNLSACLAFMFFF